MRTAVLVATVVLVVAVIAFRARAAGRGVAYTQTANSLMWSSDGYTDYTCPSSLLSGWCVLPSEAAGAAQCTADTACAGYLVPGPVSVGHTGLDNLATTAGIVQLYSKPLVSAPWATDTTVMAKPSGTA